MYGAAGAYAYAPVWDGYPTMAGASDEGESASLCSSEEVDRMTVGGSTRGRGRRGGAAHRKRNTREDEIRAKRWVDAWNAGDKKQFTGINAKISQGVGDQLALMGYEHLLRSHGGPLTPQPNPVERGSGLSQRGQSMQPIPPQVMVSLASVMPLPTLEPSGKSFEYRAHGAKPKSAVTEPEKAKTKAKSSRQK
jgi:hypothetical protein